MNTNIRENLSTWNIGKGPICKNKSTLTTKLATVINLVKLIMPIDALAAIKVKKLRMKNQVQWIWRYTNKKHSYFVFLRLPIIKESPTKRIISARPKSMIASSSFGSLAGRSGENIAGDMHSNRATQKRLSWYRGLFLFCNKMAISTYE